MCLSDEGISIIKKCSYYPGRVLASKNAVVLSGAVHLGFGSDIKDATLDGDIDGQAGISAVVL